MFFACDADRDTERERDSIDERTRSVYELKATDDYTNDDDEYNAQREREGSFFERSFLQIID